MTDRISRIARDVRETLRAFYPGADRETHYAASESIANELAERGYLDTGWRPMSEAPRDGTPILAFHDDHTADLTHVVVVWDDMEGGFVAPGPFANSSEGPLILGGWLPLPPVPAGQDSGGADG